MPVGGVRGRGRRCSTRDQEHCTASSTRCGSAATRSSGCTDAHLSQLRPRERGRRALLLELRHAPGADRRAGPRGAQGRHRPLRRPRRLHRRAPSSSTPRTCARVLEPYHARLRTELERFGGTVEKFIGDAVMASSARRSLTRTIPSGRCARRSRSATGRVEEGELAGADRRQRPARRSCRSARGRPRAKAMARRRRRQHRRAPAVRRARERDPRRRDDLPRDASSRSSTSEATPVEAKGKAEPVPVWEAVEARSRFGVDVAPERRAPLVGRERERRAPARRARSARAQEASTAARHARRRARHRQEPARLRALRRARRRARADLLAAGPLAAVRRGRQRTGRWARWSRRRRASSRPTARRRPTRSSRSVVAEALAGASDRQWVEGHLRPLVGLPRRSTAGAIDAREAFAAWRRFFEALAERSPLVLVFEDLHWADDGLLDFVDHLVDWATGVPLLVVVHGAARAARAAAGLGRRQAERGDDLALAALRRRHGAARRTRCSSGPCFRPRFRSTLLARAGGNPLYAEEFARMVAERGDGASELRLPESVQGLIAARLDALPDRGEAPAPGRGRGREGLLARRARARSARRDRRASERLLHALERKEFVRRERRRPSAARPSTRSATCSCATSPTARSRAPARRRSTARPPSGSSRSAAPRITPRCSRTTT